MEGERLQRAMWRLAAFGVATGVASGAAAQEPVGALTLFGLPGDVGRDVVLAAIVMGVLAFALLSALHLMRERRQADQERGAMERELATLRARLTRAESLLDVPDQRIIVWTAADDRPTLRGRLSRLSDVPEEREAFIAFGTWMTPDTARPFAAALEALRERAAPFDLTVETRGGSILEAEGRASGAQAFVRFKELGEEQAAQARLREEHARTAARLDAVTTLLERMDHPAWCRDPEGRTTFVNRAYVHAVEGTSVESVLRHGTPLLDRRDREAAAQYHEQNRDAFAVRASLWRKRLPVTVAGDRRALDVSEACTASGTVGFAVDMHEVERVRASFEATVESHVRTLDHLTTAVASFDESRRLRFHNQAFLSLWGLEPSVLQDAPSNDAVLEELRARGRIAEQRDFRAWRDEVLGIYQAEGTYEDRWILPDGRTIRVVANPEPAGGVTWVFENVTEQQELETAFAELTRVQGETLDHLSEAVAVFGSDGRLKLSNPAFAAAWGLPETLVQRDAPLTAITAALREATVPDADGVDVWDELQLAITGSGERKTRAGQLIARPAYDSPAQDDPEQRVLDYSLVPLPDGQAMMTFVDVTAATRVERALTERNDALMEGERLKNRFLSQVSIAFRAPLQSIEGFAGMLHSGMAGKLAERQENYIGYVMSSAAELKRLVDNTLDLATMQAGVATLDFAPTQMDDVLRGASEEVASRLAERDITLDLEIARTSGSATIDGDRIRHAMVNLLSNAVRHSPVGGRIRLRCSGDPNGVDILVSDEGPGIAPELHDMIFRNFETGGSGGAGLGLAIVRTVVELHGGTIELASDAAAKDGAGDSNDTLGGASFHVRLPRDAARHSDAA